MRKRWWIPAVILIAAPLAVLADPGDVVTDYGDGGRVEIDAVTSNVGVTGVVSDPAGRAAVTFAGDPASGTAALVTGDGSAVFPIELDGPGEVAFGPDGFLYSAHEDTSQVSVSRYDASGTVDPEFGSGGAATVPQEGKVPGGLLVDDGVVAVGGLLGPDPDTAWAARFDSAGNVDSDFGDDGVVTLLTDEEGEADLMLATDVHPVDTGYLAVVLTRTWAGDSVEVVTFDGEGVDDVTRLAIADEIFSVASTSMADGGVMVAIQVSEGDTDEFHLYRFRSDGALDPDFDKPALSDDEVAGPVRLAGLRTGEVAVAYNRGPDAGFVVRLVSPSGEDTGTLDLDLDAWMYGVTALAHDGSLVVAVDETPVNSIEPDDLTLVKVTGDESGRFIDDDSSVHASNIEELARRDITRGCNPPTNTRFCPQDSVTRGQVAAFLVRALGLPAGHEDAFTDDADSVFEGDIDALAAAGITRGCNPPDNTQFCPDDPVTRGQMAAFLGRALGLAAVDEDAFTDDADSVFEGDIDALAAAGITRGCNPPDNTQYCPTDPVTRGQMASFLIRALPED